MNLSYSNDLPVHKLASAFGNTSATYKFYSLLDIIELLEEGQRKRSAVSYIAHNNGFEYLISN